MIMYYKLTHWRYVSEEAYLPTWTSQKKHSLQLLSFEVTSVLVSVYLLLLFFAFFEEQLQKESLNGQERGSSVPAKHYPGRELP